MYNFTASTLLDHLTPDTIADIIRDLYYNDLSINAAELMDTAWRALWRNCGADAIGYMTARDVDYTEFVCLEATHA